MGQSVEEEIAALHQIQAEFFSITQEYTALLKLVVDKSSADQHATAIEQAQLKQISAIWSYGAWWNRQFKRGNSPQAIQDEYAKRGEFSQKSRDLGQEQELEMNRIIENNFFDSKALILALCTTEPSREQGSEAANSQESITETK